MELHILKDSKEFSHAIAEWIIKHINDTLKNQDRFTWVMSGGNTPKALYELLASPHYKNKIDWSKLHLFWGDERAVPFEDERNNAKMVYDTLLNHVDVPASQIHVMRTDIAPEKSAAEYEKILHEYFPHTTYNSQHNTFDLVLLGMGDDGHTLSLFPGTEVIHEESAWVKSYFLQAQNMYRITLTKHIVNQSSRIAFLTTGKNKAHALKEVLEGEFNPDLYPSQVIDPSNGELHWFTDEAATSLLK